MQKFLEKINEEEEMKKPFSRGFYEVNFKHLAENIQKIRTHAEKISGKKMKYLLPVKGNGYGTGMLSTAHFIQKKNLCEYLGVAHMQEAFELRESGITLPILVLGQTFSDEKFLNYIAEKNIEIALSDQKFLEKIEQFFQKKIGEQKKISVHLKLDLGMGRCGVLEKNSLLLFQKILDSKYIELKGVMMHFPVADEQEKKHIESTESQIQKFLEIQKKMKKIFLRIEDSSPESFEDILFHCANSGATLEHPNAVKGFDMIRPGIASYGYPEEGIVQKFLDLQPVVQVYSYFSLFKNFPENSSIGYGKTYFTQKKSEKIGILPVGYADGLSRMLSNKYSVFSEFGEKFLCVGRVSMDQSAYKIPENSGISDNDIQKIFILGKYQTAKELAKIQGTISYEVLIHFGSSDRLRKVWVG